MPVPLAAAGCAVADNTVDCFAQDGAQTTYLDLSKDPRVEILKRAMAIRDLVLLRPETQWVYVLEYLGVAKVIDLNHSVWIWVFVSWDCGDSVKCEVSDGELDQSDAPGVVTVQVSVREDSEEAPLATAGRKTIKYSLVALVTVKLFLVHNVVPEIPNDNHFPVILGDRSVTRHEAKVVESPGECEVDETFVNNVPLIPRNGAYEFLDGLVEVAFH